MLISFFVSLKLFFFFFLLQAINSILMLCYVLVLIYALKLMPLSRFRGWKLDIVLEYLFYVVLDVSRC